MQKNKTVQFPKVKGRTQINFIRNPSFKNSLFLFISQRNKKKITEILLLENIESSTILTLATPA